MFDQRTITRSSVIPWACISASCSSCSALLAHVISSALAPTNPNGASAEAVTGVADNPQASGDQACESDAREASPEGRAHRRLDGDGVAARRLSSAHVSGAREVRDDLGTAEALMSG